MKAGILTCLTLVPILAIAGIVYSSRENGDKAGWKYSQEREFPYKGSTFTSFVDDSYRVAGKGSAQEFYDWMDQALQAKMGETWDQWIAAHKQVLAGLSGPKRVAAEIQTDADLHNAIKKTITKFSLDRGFEFFNTVGLSERQCFLQSVIIAGILQRVGVTAGVAMVYRNIEGQPSNNGHAVCLAKLSDGRDIVVDASEPMPFPTHRGLFMYDASAGHYQYVEPAYGKDATIASYRLAGANRTVSPAVLRGLDVPFLRSQFDYYRGERSTDGILDSKPTVDGLRTSAKYFERSQRENAANPLNVYMLGRTYQKLGKTADAMDQYHAAANLYRQFGWTPNGMRDALAQK